MCPHCIVVYGNNVWGTSYVHLHFGYFRIRTPPRNGVSKLERSVCLFSRPWCWADSDCRQNGRGHSQSRAEVHLLDLSTFLPWRWCCRCARGLRGAAGQRRWGRLDVKQDVQTPRGWMYACICLVGLLSSISLFVWMNQTKFSMVLFSLFKKK